MKDFIPLWLRAPRSSLFLLLSVLLLAALAVVSPVQLPVALYKLTLIALAAVVGYWLDRALFPYARPDGYLYADWRYGTEEPEGASDFPVLHDYHLVFCAAMLRRAIVVGTVVIGVAMGL